MGKVKKMIKIDNSRYTIHNNEIWANFSNYTVCIKPSISDNWKNEWNVMFIKGDYSHSITCSTLEEAFYLIDCYSNQTKFDKLMKELGENYES